MISTIADGPEPEHDKGIRGGMERRTSAFCDTDEVKDIVARGMSCLDAGVPVHLCGAAGIGKTALAIRMAAEIGRPMALLAGHEGLAPQDFIGREVGHSESVVVDKYIQSVRRKKTESRVNWADALLAASMRNGHTLIYDEFTRASPEANVMLLSVLEEGLLVSGRGADGHRYVRAHPEFRIILTSNPSDYVAVNSAPDALLDRMVTFRLEGYSARAEAEIVRVTCGIDLHVATRIVDIVKTLRGAFEDALLPSMRASILIGRIVGHELTSGPIGDGRLEEIVSDVIRGRAPQIPRSTITDVIRSTSNGAKVLV